MKITIDYIKSLNPCKDRLDNFIKHYPNFNGTMHEFLDLELIFNTDKAWVYFRSIPENRVPLVAADIAESVLHIFEEAFPNDNRPRLAIEAARKGNIARTAIAAIPGRARSATWYAVDYAANSAADFAAWSAYCAAWSAYWHRPAAAITHAVQSAYYANRPNKNITIMKKWWFEDEE